MKTFTQNARAVVESLLASYAGIIFSRSRVAGGLILAATFFSPWHGISGVLGTLAAMVVARFSGLQARGVTDGRLFYNSAMVSLLLACWVPPDALPPLAYAVLLLIVSVAALGLTVVLNARSLVLNGIPAMSLPFWVVATALHWFLVQRGFSWQPAVWPVSWPFPEIVNTWLRSIGVISFSVAPAAGFLVTFALAWTSRFHVWHAMCGFLVSCGVFALLGFPAADAGWIHLSCMFTALALGGGFYVPSRHSFVLAIAGSALCAFIGAALLRALQLFDAPLLTLPFNLTTVAVVSALRWRMSQTGPRNVTGMPRHPEEALRTARLSDARLPEPHLPAVGVPFDGEWVATQGFEGALTHRGPWRHAFDFEVAGADGQPARPPSSELGDFASFGAPILAPADGLVVRVIDSIRDNAVGAVNMSENWGNTVVLEVATGVFVQLSHLRQRGVSVREGERIRQGSLIGYLGNSGRSPVPHLHMQMQLSPEIGSPTIPFRLRGYRTPTDADGWRFHFRGCPREGQRVAGCRPARWITDGLIALFSNGEERSFRTFNSRGESREQVRYSLAADGSLLLTSQSARLHLGLLENVLIPLGYHGSRRSLLWIFWLMGRIPLCSCPGLEWEEPRNPHIISGLRDRLQDLASAYACKPLPTGSSRIEAADRHGGEFVSVFSVPGVCSARLTLRASQFFTSGRLETSREWMSFVLDANGDHPKHTPAALRQPAAILVPTAILGSAA